jgi:hypothetical protein
MAIGNLEIRMAHLEGAYEQIEKRLGTVETDVRGLRTDLVSRTDDLASRIDRVDGRMNSLRSDLIGRMDRQFFWTLGLLIVSILLPIARSSGH